MLTYLSVILLIKFSFVLISLLNSNGEYRKIVFRGTSGVIDKYGFLASNTSGPIYSSNTGIVASALTSAAGETVDLSLEIGEADGGITAVLTVDGEEKDIASSSTNIENTLSVGDDVYLEEVGFWQSGNLVAKLGSFKITDNDGTTVAPDEVTNVTVSDGEYGNVEVSWDAADGATSYIITADSDSESYEYTSTTNSITISDSLTNGNSYVFTVQAKNSAGETTGVSSSEFALDSVSGITDLVASTDVEGGVDLSWTDVTNESGYNVYRDDVLIDTLDEDSISYSETISEGSYSYEVIPYNNAGETADDSTCITTSSIFHPYFILTPAFPSSSIPRPNPLPPTLTSKPFSILNPDTPTTKPQTPCATPPRTQRPQTKKAKRYRTTSNRTTSTPPSK